MELSEVIEYLDVDLQNNQCHLLLAVSGFSEILNRYSASDSDIVTYLTCIKHFGQKVRAFKISIKILKKFSDGDDDK